MTRQARIVGWGKYLPKKVLTNNDLAAMVDTSDAWIRSRTGIKERRIAADYDTASTMGIEAGRQALEIARLPASSLDLIIAATVTPETIFPACASLIQHGLGADKAAAFDLNAACSGFVYALITAYQFISQELIKMSWWWGARSTPASSIGGIVIPACSLATEQELCFCN